MTEQEVEKVQTLVKAKHYGAAQTFLKSLGDDPQAKHWLGILQNIPPERTGKRDYKKTAWNPNRYIVIGILIFCFYFFFRDALPVILQILAHALSGG